MFGKYFLKQYLEEKKKENTFHNKKLFFTFCFLFFFSIVFICFSMTILKK